MRPSSANTGAHLRAVHDVVLDGFGSVTVGPALRGEETRHGRKRSSGVPWAWLRSSLPDSCLRSWPPRTGAVLDGHRDRFDSVESARLLHGDFHPRHVYGVGGHITGVIDWGDATAGDPVFDLGTARAAGIRDQSVEAGFELLGCVLDGYGDAPWLHGDVATKLLLYGVVFSVWSMHGEFQSGAPWPPWWPMQCEALSLLLAALERC